MAPDVCIGRMGMFMMESTYRAKDMARVSTDGVMDENTRSVVYQKWLDCSAYHLRQSYDSI